MLQKNIILFFKDFLEILNEMSVYLLLGFLFAGILNVLIPKHKVKKFLGGNSVKSVFYASVLGVPLPLCSCGVIPTGISFYKNGASKGATNSFLISTPQTGIDSILVTYSLLGLPFAVIRPFIALVTGVVGGIFTNKIDKQIPVKPIQTTEKEEKKSVFDRLFKYAFVDFLQDIANWLVIGLLIAAFISVVIPDGFFSNYLDNDLLSMLVILVASIPLYVCATSSVPIAAVLIMKGISPGAALVFLMAGPATNAATIAVIKNAMGAKALWAYLISIIVGSLLFGYLINYFLPAEWFQIASSEHLHHEHGILPYWLKIISSIILFILILNAYWQKYKHKFLKNIKNNNSDTMEKTTVKINGMNCNHCKQNVTNALQEIDSIKDIEVDLGTETAILSGTHINLAEVKQKVEQIGYKFGGLAN